MGECIIDERKAREACNHHELYITDMNSADNLPPSAAPALEAFFPLNINDLKVK